MGKTWSEVGRRGRRAIWAVGGGTVALLLASCGHRGPLGGDAQDDAGPPVTSVPPVAPCPQPAIVRRRIERLTLRQITNVVRDLLGDDVANALVAQLSLDDPALQFFPPLDSTREGTVVFGDRLVQSETIAAAGAQYVHDHYADVVGCDISVDCVRRFVAAFAQRAYRRPLEPAESQDLDQEISDLQAIGSDAQETAQYGAYAVLMAPQFLYRSELGFPAAAASSTTDVGLTPYEMASELSFVFTDGPPDAPLLDAAAQGTLATDAGLTEQVNRLLETPAARRTLSNAVSVYFGLNLMTFVFIDPLRVPELNPSLESAMTTEASMFLDEVLWHRDLPDLLISTTSFVNSDLAATVYGIPVPAGATATDFVRVELPADQRAGLLTRAAYITAHARIDLGSLVARGLAIGQATTCDVVPPPPDAIVPEEVNIINATKTWTQRARAEQRLSLPECAVCHADIDSYGFPFESYDVIGRYRTQDEQGQPIDPSTTLPAAFGDQPVRDAVDLSRKIAIGPRFTACLTKSFLQYALGDIGAAPLALDNCAVTNTAARFAASRDQSFSSFIREIARSPALARRRSAR